jgi:hypothetical protein
MDERDGPCGFSAVDGPHGPHGERGQFALPHGFLSNSQQNSLSYAVGASSLVLAGLASDYAAATLPSCARSFQVLGASPQSKAAPWAFQYEEHIPNSRMLIGNRFGTFMILSLRMSGVTVPWSHTWDRRNGERCG